MNAQQKSLLYFLKNRFRGEYLCHEPLARHTWYQIGGPTDFFIYPHNQEELVTLLQQCRMLEMPVCFIGEGANMLVSDEGYRGVMIHLGRFITSLTHEEHKVTVAAGTSLQRLILYAEHHGLGGLEGLAGIPGTVGGALIMNAGTHQGEIGDCVHEVLCLNEALEPETLSHTQLHFQYRSVPELQERPILGCVIALYETESALLRERRQALLARRSATQPLDYPSCGSVFKRPPHNYVGKMVEQLGLKGIRYGNAMISDKHGGFILNLGQAKAAHVLYLLRKIQYEVHQHFGVALEPEVKLIGFEKGMNV